MLHFNCGTKCKHMQDSSAVKASVANMWQGNIVFNRECPWDFSCSFRFALFYPVVSDKSGIRPFLMTFLYPSVEIDLQVKAYIIAAVSQSRPSQALCVVYIGIVRSLMIQCNSGNSGSLWVCFFLGGGVGGVPQFSWHTGLQGRVLPQCWHRLPPLTSFLFQMCLPA